MTFEEFEKIRVTIPTEAGIYKYIGEKSTDCENVIIFNADAYKDVSQNQLQLF